VQAEILTPALEFWPSDGTENAGTTMRQRATEATSIRALIDSFIFTNLLSFPTKAD
jgi:hypothetical protein